MYHKAVLLVASFLPMVALADDSALYRDIADRHPAVKLDAQSLARARGEGECLASIKAINSLPPQEFHPNIEWLRLRTSSLLRHMKPCEVLIMLEAAHDALDTENAPRNRDG